MTTPTELEKTQLEIAKLQLEQERHKLGQMKKRQKVVDDLGAGAAMVGGAAAKGAGWAVFTALAALGGLAVGLVIGALLILNNVDAPAGLGWLEGVGYRLGAHQTGLIVSALLGVVLVVLASFAKDGRSR